MSSSPKSRRRSRSRSSERNHRRRREDKYSTERRGERREKRGREESRERDRYADRERGRDRGYGREGRDRNDGSASKRGKSRRNDSPRAARARQRSASPPARQQEATQEAARAQAPPGVVSQFDLPLTLQIPQGQQSQRLVSVYRFLNPRPAQGQNSPYQSALSSTNPRAYERQRNNLIRIAQTDPNTLHTQAVSMHTDVGNEASPFISVGLNPLSIAASPDDSPGGVAEIVRNAPNLEQFDVPVEFLLPGLSETSRGETEMVVLLPPGDSLDRYRPRTEGGGIQANPFRGMDAAAIQRSIRQQDRPVTVMEYDGRSIREVVPQQDPPPQENNQADREELRLADMPLGIRQRIEDTVVENMQAEGYRNPQAHSDYPTKIQAFIEENKDAILRAIQNAN